LIHEAPLDVPIYLVDPDPAMKRLEKGRLTVIQEKATTGLPMVARILDSYE